MQTKTTFSWIEVLAELTKGNHEAFFIPHEDEHEGALFEKKQIPLDDITDYTTYEEFLLIGVRYEIEAVERLIKAYKRGEPVPPIVLDDDGKIIDGYHRLPAQLFLKRNSVEAFVKIVA